MKHLILVAMPQEAMVLTEELGPRAKTLVTGMGKVNAAAMAVQAALYYKPDVVLNVGTAGGIQPGMKVGDVVIGTRHIQHDYGRLDENGWHYYRPGELPIGDRGSSYPEYRQDPTWIQFLAEYAQHENPGVTVHGAMIATGDTFLATKEEAQRLNLRTGAYAVEMEAGAIAQICSHYRIKYVCIKGISDLACEESTADFQTRLREATLNAAKVTSSVLTHL